MAQALAETLDSVFMLNSEVDTLSNKIQEKKQTITIQNWELEALQARIREAEERLKLKESMAVAPNSNTHVNKDHNNLDNNTSPFDQDESASSPISDSYPSEGGFTDASTAPSTTYNEDAANKDDVDDVDCQTIREVGLNRGSEAEIQNTR
ncbi:hypothetical protein PRK78_002635 [Emydomyces testavorans]|uniref:Uncharacterized protein n=1 Tax=Emydomyces testavorans TaxID=2070801 RepID=A0AAF0DF89_9EURO|nr:hypothetical protein PRK78_002635 [Emydomyces testavorans]